MNKPKSSKASQKALAASSREIMGDTRAARNSYFQQLQNAIQTGGSGGRIPILNAALGGSNYGKARTLEDTTGAVNRAGLGGTDFGAGIERGTAVNADVDTSNAREAIIKESLGQAPNAALTFAQQGQAGLAQSAGTNAAISQSNQSNQTALIGAGAAGVGAIAGAIILAVT